MRILQVFNRYLERGGEEKSVERIALHLEASGEEVIRFWVSSEEWTGSDAPSKFQQLCSIFYNREMERRLEAEIAKSSPDLILTHNVFPVVSPAVYAFSLRKKIPLVQFIHNFRPFSVGGSLWLGERVAKESLTGSYIAEVKAGAWQNSQLKSVIMALVLKNLHWQGWLRGVSHWIAISDFMREQFIEAGVEEEKISTLRHSWSADPEEPLAYDEGYYLFLGRLVPEKGLRTLIASWKILEERLGEEAPSLVIAGSGIEEDLVKRASENMATVEYRGFVEGDVKKKLIAGSRAMLAPSVWWEPLGLVTYEAYEAGKPMIAAASGGLTETIEEGETGFLHEPESASSLADCIEKVESLGYSGRREMGLKGRSWLLREGSPQLWSERFEEVLAPFRP